MKKLLLILAITLSVSFHSQAQNREQNQAPASIVRFYPNPATTVITFDFQKSTEKNYSIQIYNFMGGRKMYEQSNISDKATVNVSDFARGVYIYQLRDRTGRLVESGKFQVSR